MKPSNLEKQKSQRVIFLANQFIGDSWMSGGDVLAVEIMRRTQKNIVIITTDCIQKKLSKSLISPRYTFVCSEENTKKIQNASTIFGGMQTVIAYLFRSWRTCKWLRQYLVSGDVVYLTGDFICNALPAFFAHIIKKDVCIVVNFFHKIPVTRSGSNSLILSGFFSRLLQKVSLRLLKNITNKFFVLSVLGREELINSGVKLKKIIVSGAGVQKSKILPYLRTSKRKNHLIYIGRLNESKGVFELPNILSMVKKLNPDFHCTVVGYGEKFANDRLLSLANKYGVAEHITLTGHIDDDKKYKLLASSCALLLPSREEGYGIVIQEAVTLGVNVVCYDLPTLRHLFGRINLVKYVSCYSDFEFARSINVILQGATNSRQSELSDDTLQDLEDVYRIQAKHFDCIN